jgi:hypothetical protein
MNLLVKYLSGKNYKIISTLGKVVIINAWNLKHMWWLGKNR